MSPGGSIWLIRGALFRCKLNVSLGGGCFIILAEKKNKNLLGDAHIDKLEPEGDNGRKTSVKVLGYRASLPGTTFKCTLNLRHFMTFSCPFRAPLVTSTLTPHEEGCAPADWGGGDLPLPLAHVSLPELASTVYHCNIDNRFYFYDHFPTGGTGRIIRTTKG